MRQSDDKEKIHLLLGLVKTQNIKMLYLEPSNLSVISFDNFVFIYVCPNTFFTGMTDSENHNIFLSGISLSKV